MNWKAIALGAAMSIGLGSAASAQMQIVSIGSPLKPIAGPANQFKPELNGLGYDSFYDINDVKMLGSGVVKFYYVAKETVTRNTFEIGPLSFGPTPGLLDGGYTYVDNKFAAPVLIGSLTVNAGDTFSSLGFKFESRNYLTNALIKSAAMGTVGAGTFVKAGGPLTSNIWYFGFDDQQELFADDNHDDLIIYAQFVPEPAAWAMLLAGFGLTAVALRRRDRLAISG